MTDPRNPSSEMVAAAVELTERLTGVIVPEYRWSLLGSELIRRCPTGKLESTRLEELVNSTPLIDLVTIPESYLFRHEQHFNLLRQLARKRRRLGRPCVVVCAGCASGEEVWSAAAVLAAVPPPEGTRHRVVGWEISPARIQRATQGRFGPWSARKGLLGYERYFHSEGDQIVASPVLREMVSFECVNLVSDPLPLQHRPDALFFRNVSIYWREDTIRHVCGKLADTVDSQGVILVGPSDPVVMPPEWQHRLCGGTRTFWKHDVPCPESCAKSHNSRGKGSSGSRCKRDVGPRKTQQTRQQNTAQHTKLPQPKLERQPSTSDHSSKPPHELAADEIQPELLEEVARLADQAQYAQALALLEKSADRERVEQRLWHGILLLSLDRNDEALQLFRQCVFLAPEVAEHHHWLAMAYDALGDHHRAEKQRRNVSPEEAP